MGVYNGYCKRPYRSDALDMDAKMLYVPQEIVHERIIEINLEVTSVKFNSVHLFALINFNFTNYNDNHAFGKQSRKLFCFCLKERSKKLECTLSMAEQKY